MNIDEYKTLTAANLSAYDAWVAAEAAWTQMLRALFGKDSGDARYTAAGAGPAGSKLRELHDAFMAAGDARRYANIELQAFKSLHKHEEP